MGETRGPLANRCLGVLRELLHMLADSWAQLGSEIREFLEGIYRATTAISTMAISKQLGSSCLSLAWQSGSHGTCFWSALEVALQIASCTSVLAERHCFWDM